MVSKVEWFKLLEGCDAILAITALLWNILNTLISTDNLA